jgi:hypothetical protein
MKTKRMLIEIVKADNGYYLKADNGELPEEGYRHGTRQGAYAAAMALYPDGGVWDPKPNMRGITITIN